MNRQAQQAVESELCRRNHGFFVVTSSGLLKASSPIELECIVGMTREQRQSKRFAVYVLRDPRTNSIHWVGVSSNVKLRIHSHFAHRNWLMHSERQAAYASWMRDLHLAGLRPLLEVVSDGYQYSYEEALRIESELTAIYKICGQPVFNCAAQPTRIDH